MTFDQRVWQLLKRIPKGKITTYKLLARALNCRGYRAVGNACHRNPYAPNIPCHRVVNSNGSLGGYGGGLRKKKRLLKREGVIIKNNTIRNFEQYLFKFPSERHL